MGVKIDSKKQDRIGEHKIFTVLGGSGKRGVDSDVEDLDGKTKRRRLRRRWPRQQCLAKNIWRTMRWWQ